MKPYFTQTTPGTASCGAPDSGSATLRPGAISRVDDAASAFGHRSARLILNINARWSDPGESPRHIEWTRALFEALQPYSGGGVYVNFLGNEGQDRVRHAYGEAKYQRLVELKNRWDPTNFFRINQNIEPTAMAGVPTAESTVPMPRHGR